MEWSREKANEVLGRSGGKSEEEIREELAKDFRYFYSLGYNQRRLDDSTPFPRGRHTRRKQPSRKKVLAAQKQLERRRKYGYVN